MTGRGLRRGGVSVSTTPAWVSLALDALERKGWSRVELARRVGCAPARITDILNGLPSRYVPDVSIALDISPPWTALGSEAVRALVPLFEELLQRSKGKPSPSPFDLMRQRLETVLAGLRAEQDD